MKKENNDSDLIWVDFDQTDSSSCLSLTPQTDQTKIVQSLYLDMLEKRLCILVSDSQGDMGNYEIFVDSL